MSQQGVCPQPKIIGWYKPGCEGFVGGVVLHLLSAVGLGHGIDGGRYVLVAASVARESQGKCGAEI